MSLDGLAGLWVWSKTCRARIAVWSCAEVALAASLSATVAHRVSAPWSPTTQFLTLLVAVPFLSGRGFLAHGRAYLRAIVSKVDKFGPRGGPAHILKREQGEDRGNKGH